METLAALGRPASLGELAQEVGLGKASTLRLAQTMVATGFAGRNERGDYVLNRPWVQSVTHDWLKRLTVAASSEMAELNAAIAETVSLAALFEDHIRVIEVIESPQHIRMSNYRGRILPPYASSLGKAITAFQTSERVQSLLSVYGIYSFTPRTITEPVRIREELACVREQGWAAEHEESVPGGCCFAVPLRVGDEAVRAAISVSVPSVRLDERLEKLLPELLLVSGNRISAALAPQTRARARGSVARSLAHSS